MSTTLRLTAGIEFTSASGRQVTFGSRASAYSITVDGLFDTIDMSLATATTSLVWESGSDGSNVTNFDVLWVLSTQNLEVELTIDKNGSAATPGPTIIVHQVQANVPLILTSDDFYAAPTAAYAAGTEDVCDRIRFRNISGSTATIQGAIIT